MSIYVSEEDRQEQKCLSGSPENISHRHSLKMLAVIEIPVAGYDDDRASCGDDA